MKNKNIISRDIDFTQWYTDVINEAKLISYSPVKGSMFFLPNGWSIWTQIQKILDYEFAKFNIKNIQLPLFIKYSDFTQEKKHIEGFSPEMFLINNKGDEVLSDPLVLRPTSEVSFCQLFKQMTRSYNDLPILLNQWCNVFRVEKNTRPFLRNTEFHWHELHTIHSNNEEAFNQTIKMINLYKWFANEILNIPVLMGEKTINERFAGANNTFTIEALMQDGQALQCATSHFLAQNFSKAYEIKFQDSNNSIQNVFQTSAGMSTRIIGAIIMSHSDDNGLVLPFAIAPIQISILIFNKDNNQEINKIGKETFEKLSKKYRVELDNSNKTFGFKINAHQVRGVPFILILGQKEFEQKTFTIIKRNSKIKNSVNFDSFEIFLEEQISDYGKSLFDVAQERLNNSINEISNLDEFKKTIDNKKIALSYWCNEPEEEVKLKNLTTATARCIKINLDESTDKKCFFTGKKAKALVYFARAY